MMDYHHCNTKLKKGSPSHIVTPLKDYLMQIDGIIFKPFIEEINKVDFLKKQRNIIWIHKIVPLVGATSNITHGLEDLGIADIKY